MSDEEYWDEQLLGIIDSVDAKELATVLVSKFDEVAKPNDEGYLHIGITLQRLAGLISEGKEDTNNGLWMAFWLGAAWQKACHDADQG